MVTIKDLAARCLGIVLLVGAATALAPSPVPVVGLGTQGRCTYHRAFGMMGAHCSALNLHSVPATLKTNIQILDVSFNRIRDIRNTTFQRYTSLRYLYMGDNMIQTIEAGTFYPLTSLETLDLSINALTTIPEFILNLPTLRKLYMSDNSLINLSNDLKKMEKPIKAPLHFLSLSNCHLTEIPDFGVIAELEHLNISGNELRNLSPRDFTKLCGLSTLDLTGSIYAQDACTYKSLTTWFIEKHITVIPDVNSIYNPESEETRRCPGVEFSEEDISTHSECRLTIRTKKLVATARKTWIIIVGTVVGVIVVLFIFFFWLHRRNVKQTKNVKKMLKQNELQNNKPEKLLSDVS